jgi:hypothetical protein
MRLQKTAAQTNLKGILDYKIPIVSVDVIGNKNFVYLMHSLLQLLIKW